MRSVLYVTDGLANGGAERQLTLLAKHVPASWERMVWSLGGGPFGDVLRSHGFEVHVCPRSCRYDLRPIASLWRIVLARKPELVHSWGWLTSANVAPLCRILGIPWIDGSIRIGWVAKEHVLRARIALALADRVIANSRAGLRAWGISPVKGRVIYNAIDPTRLALASRKPYREAPFTVAMAARMTGAKDFACFLEAARRITAGKTDGAWHFMAIGAGQGRAALMQAVSDLVQSGVCRFPEAGTEVLPYVRQAHIGVLMTNPALGAEGCSNAIMEYMACGLPVVCSDSGGNREIVAEGVTGFIIPPGDSAALARKLVWLKEHPEEAQRMGDAGKERARCVFSVERLVKETVAVYEELVGAA